MSGSFPRTIVAGLFAGLLAAGALADDAPPSIDKLTEQLSSKDLPVRRDAAYELSKLGKAAKPALPALVKAIDDDDKQVWSSALAALAALGPDAKETIPTLIDRFDSRKNKGRQRDVRQNAMRTAYALSKMGPDAIPPLIQALAEPDLGLRIGGARSLGNFGPAAHDAVPALIKNLADSQDVVRDETAQALGLIGAAAGPELVAALQDGDAHRRAGAATALAQMDPPYHDKAREVEQAAKKESDPVVRDALFIALPKAGVTPEDCVALFLPAITGEDEVQRHSALNALLSSTPVRKAAVPKLTPLLKDGNQAVREHAAKALGRIGSTAADALPALMDAAHKADGAPVYAEALASIGPKALPSLLDTLQKSKPNDSKWVLRVLHAFGSPAVPVLTEALKNNSPEVRVAAASALGEMGRDATTAAPTLFTLSRDGSPAVQAAAFRALVAVHADSSRLKPLLEAALTSSNTDVRKAAAAGVASLGGAATLGVNGLLDLLDDENAAGRLAAIQALGQLGPKAAGAVPALVTRLDDATMQSSIIETLGQIGSASEPAVPKLIELAKKPDEKASILPVFTNIGHAAKAALPTIYDGVKDNTPEVRAAAVTALASVEADDSKALAVLLQLVKDGTQQSGKVRRATVHALAKYGPAAQPAVPSLVAMLNKETDRSEAMRTLKTIGVRSVPDLLTMLSVHDTKVRQFACESLGSLGPEAKDAAPKLRELAQQDGSMKAPVDAALKKIEPTVATPAPGPAPAQQAEPKK